MTASAYISYTFCKITSTEGSTGDVRSTNFVPVENDCQHASLLNHLGGVPVAVRKIFILKLSPSMT